MLRIKRLLYSKNWMLFIRICLSPNPSGRMLSTAYEWTLWPPGGLRACAIMRQTDDKWEMESTQAGWVVRLYNYMPFNHFKYPHLTQTWLTVLNFRPTTPPHMPPSSSQHDVIHLSNCRWCMMFVARSSGKVNELHYVKLYFFTHAMLFPTNISVFVSVEFKGNHIALFHRIILHRQTSMFRTS